MIYPLKGLYGRVDRDISAQPTSQFSINPLLLRAIIEKDEYCFYFNNMCYSGQPTRGNLIVNQSTLRDKLNSWIHPSDRKYVRLVSFTNEKSKFVFDIDSWLEDSLKTCVPDRNFFYMSQSYRLNKSLPYMVTAYGMEMTYGKYITDHFKAYLKRNKIYRNRVLGAMEKVADRAFGLSSLSVFEYRYNKMSNTIVMSVKPVFAASLIAAGGALLKSRAVKKDDFDKSVGVFLKIR